MTRSIPKLARTLAALLAVGLIAAACGDGGGETPGPDDTGAATGDTGGETGASDAVVTTYIGEPEHLSPGNSSESEGIAVLNAIFTQLVEFDPETTEPFNAVAESIESDDLQTWTVTLKDGWTFHDGSPVNAQSFVDAWNYAALGTNAQQNANFFSNIQGYDEVNPSPPEGESEAPAPTAETMSGLEVVDDTTFTVTLAEPFAQWPLTIGYPAFSPLPPAFFEDPEGFENAPIGNGPLMVDGQWNHNQNIMTTRYEEYAGEDAVQIGGVEFVIYADQNTAYNDLLAGNLDIMDSLPPERTAEAQDQFGERYGTSPSSSFNYLGYPMYVPEFGDNPDLRHALSLAIDRQSIVDTIFDGTREPASSFISPVIPGYREDACAETATFDAEAATAAFEAAGGLDAVPDPLVVWFNSGAGHDAWVEAVTNMWRDTLGIQNFEFQQLQFAEYLPLLDEQGATGPFRLGWGMDYPSPQNYLEPLYSSGAVPPGGSNATFYTNEEFDALIADGNTKENLDEAIPVYQQAEDILCEDLPVIPMFYGQNQYAWSENVDGVYVTAFSDVAWSEVTATS